MMDQTLSEITLAQFYVVEDTLSNDEKSTDEEILNYFYLIGLSEEQSRRALQYRNLYLDNIFVRGASPIMTGDDSYRYNPYTSTVERFHSKL